MRPEFAHIPRPKIEDIDQSYLKLREGRNDRAIGRITNVYRALLGQNLNKIPVKLPDALNLLGAKTSEEWEERKQRVEEAKRKIMTSTLPLLRIRERQIDLALSEAIQVETAQRSFKAGRVTEKVVEMNKESLIGAIVTLMEPIRPHNEQPEKPSETPAREFGHLFPNQLNALNLIIDNVLAIPAEICAALGTTKKGKPYNRQQANVALRKAIGRLVAHHRKGDMTPEETEVYKKIGDYVKNHGLYTHRDMEALIPGRLDIKRKK